VDGHNRVEFSPSVVKDKPLDTQEEQKESPPFIMPLVANPNVRDPMSAPWSPVQSGPSTPVAGLAYLPAVTKFRRDNQLLGNAHTSSGLFTPLEGSGSSSPSPIDTVTPEDRSGVDVETEAQILEDDEQHQEEQATPVPASPMTTSLEIPEVEPEDTPTGLSEDDGWGEIPRLPTPPAEITEHVESVLSTGSATRVFFQPEPSENVSGPDVRADRSDDTKDGDLPVLAADILRKEKGDTPGLDTAKPLAHTTDDPFKLMGNNSTVVPGAAANDDDESYASSSPGEELTPRLGPQTSSPPAV